MADSINRSDLVSAIAASTGQSQASVNGVLDALLDELAANVSKGVKVSVPGWFSVERTHRAARSGRNPATGEQMNKPADRVAKVTIAKQLKEVINA